MDEFVFKIAGTPAANWGALLLLAAAAAGLGAGVAGLLRLRPHALVEFVLGLNLLAVVAFAAQRLILTAAPGWSALLFALPAAGGVWSWYRRRAAAGAWLWRHRVGVGLVVIFCVLTLGSALCLPYAWDEQTYQVTLPLRWLQLGSCAVNPDNPYSAFPALPQFVLLPGYRLGGIRFARLWQWLLYGVLFLGLYAELARCSGRRIAPVLTVVAMVCPAVAAMNREVYAEPWLVLDLLAGLVLLRTPLTRRGMAALGLLAGGALAVKLTGLGVALALGVGGLRRNRGRWLWPGVLTALALGLIFYSRAWLATGNPVYPFGGSLVPGTPAATLVEECHRQMGLYYYGLGPVSTVFLGWCFAAFSEKLFDGVILGFPFLALVVLAVAGRWLGRGWSRATRQQLLLALVLYGFWALSSPQGRFLLPLYFLLLLPAGRTLAGWRRRHPTAVRMTLLGLLVLAAVSVALDRFSYRHFYLAYRARRDFAASPRRYLEYTTRDRPLLATLDYLARETPPESRVLLVAERRGLYLPRPYLLGSPCFQELLLTPLPATAAETWAQLRRHGVDYVLFFDSRRNPDRLPQYNELYWELGRQLHELLRQGKLELVTVPDSGDCTLLRMGPK